MDNYSCSNLLNGRNIFPPPPSFLLLNVKENEGVDSLCANVLVLPCGLSPPKFFPPPFKMMTL